MLSGRKEIDLEILQKLEDNELSSVCQVNKYVARLCNDESFWLNRLITKQGLTPSEIKKMKGNFSYKQLYRFLFLETEKGLNLAAETNNVYLYKKLYFQIEEFTDILDSVSLAAEKGSIDVLSFLFIYTDGQEKEYLLSTVNTDANKATFIWLDKMGLALTPYYIISVFFKGDIQEARKYIMDLTDQEKTELMFLIGSGIRFRTLEAAKELLDFALKENVKKYSALVEGTEEAKRDDRLRSEEGKLKYRDWLRYLDKVVPK